MIAGLFSFAGFRSISESSGMKSVDAPLTCAGITVSSENVGGTKKRGVPFTFILCTAVVWGNKVEAGRFPYQKTASSACSLIHIASIGRVLV